MKAWFVAAYSGSKSEFINFPMFVIDGKIAATEKDLIGCKGEKGLVVECAKVGEKGKQEGIYGCFFPHGSTGIVSLGDGTVCFSEDEATENSGIYTGGFFININKYRIMKDTKNLFEKI